MLFQKVQVLGGRGAKHIIGVAFQQVELIDNGAGYFADGFFYGPKPGGVDVGVPNGRRVQTGSGGRVCQQRRECVACSATVKWIVGIRRSRLHESALQSCFAHTSLR